MRQIITLEKEIAFKTMIGDITSISLEHDLDFISDSEIEGNLIVSGTYKLTEASTIEENFNYKVPVEIMLTSSLVEDKRSIDINNFVYKIVNEESLLITVELLIEGLEKIEVDEVVEEEANQEEVRKDTVEDFRNDNVSIENKTEEVFDDNVLQSIDDNALDIEVLKTDEDDSFKEVDLQEDIESSDNVLNMKEEINDNNNNKEVMDSIFSAFANTEETYATYSVYILRENDNLDEVINKYKTNREVLSEYNDLDNLRVGSKIIIPSILAETNE